MTWTAPAANGLTITGYNAQYRKKVADGRDRQRVDRLHRRRRQRAADQRAARHDDQHHLPGLEAGATYEVQVRAVTSEEGEGPWSDAGEGRANRPPNLTAWILADYTGTWGREVTGDVGNVFADADGDTLTFAATPTYPGVASVRVDGSALYTNILNPAATVITYGAHDGYGGYKSRTFTVTGQRGCDAVRPRELAGRHGGGRPGDGHALRRRGRSDQRRSELHAERRGGDLGRLRHRLGHGPDQREAGRHLRPRDEELLHRQGALDRAGPGRRLEPHDRA